MEATDTQSNNELEQTYEISIAWEQIAEEAIKKLKEIQRERALPGFRRGKTPVALLLRQFGKLIQEDCAREKLQEAFEARLQEQGLELAAFIDITMLRADWQADAVFAIKFEAKPNFDLIEFDQLSYPKFDFDPEFRDDDHVDGILLLIKLFNSDEWDDMPAGTVLQRGDSLIIDVWAQVEEKDFDSESGFIEADAQQESSSGAEADADSPNNIYWHIVQSERLVYFDLPDRDMSRVFPEVLEVLPELELEKPKVIPAKADKKLRVMLRNIGRYPDTSLPDDEFVAKLNIPDINTVDELRQHIRDHINATNKFTLYSSKDNAFDRCILAHYAQLALPKVWIRAEAQRLHQNTVDRLVQENNIKPAQAERMMPPVSMYSLRARPNILRSLIADKYLQHYKSQLREVHEADLQTHVQSQIDHAIDLTCQSPWTQNIYRSFYSDKLADEERREEVRKEIQSYNLLDLFTSKAKAVDADEWAQQMQRRAQQAIVDEDAAEAESEVSEASESVVAEQQD